MKNIISCIALCLFALQSFAQKDTFDIVTYAAPGGWQKNVDETNLNYTTSDQKTNTWCRIFIIKSTNSKGGIEQDFESEWKGLVVKNYKPTAEPQVDSVLEIDGWKIKSGTAPFTVNSKDAIAILTTASGFDRCVSVVAITNSEDHLKDVGSFLSSVELIKPEMTVQPAANSNYGGGVADKSTVLGIWSKTSSSRNAQGDPAAEGADGYSKDQYTFKANGTYDFVSKIFMMNMTDLIFVKESGTYKINGTSITINPEKCVIQSWSKKDGVDKWGRLLSSKNKALEKVTYTFTKHYFSGIDEWNLVLQADKPTKREGPFSNNLSFNNAWYFRPILPNNPIIELPDKP